MTQPLASMLGLARVLFANGELPLLEDVLRMATAVAPGDRRVVTLLLKVLAGRGRHDLAIATGAAWTMEHGLHGEVLDLVTQCHADLGSPRVAVSAVRAILAGPERPEAYRQLAAVAGSSGSRSADRVLRWLTPWLALDDPQAAIALHKAYAVGRGDFDLQAERLIRSRPDLLWAPYFRAMLAHCVDRTAPRPCDLALLASEPAPAYRRESLACVAGWAGPTMRAFRSRGELFAHCVSGLLDTPLGQTGAYLEFGVAEGVSARLIAGLVDGPLHAFDSFQGLPESWEAEAAGSYSTGGRIPELPDNVRVHVGWFSDTIPRFRAETEGPIALLHIDCDLYSSTVDVFAGLGDRLTEGSVVVFDEYFGYPGFEKHEMRAFDEFRRATGWRAVAIGIVPFTKKLAFRLHRG